MLRLGKEVQEYWTEKTQLAQQIAELEKRKREITSQIHSAFGQYKLGLLPDGTTLERKHIAESTYTATRRAHWRLQLRREG